MKTPQPMQRSIFNKETEFPKLTERFVRSSIESHFGGGFKLPPTRSLELYTILPVDTDVSTGALFMPQAPYLAYLLDVGWPATPALYTVANEPTKANVRSVPNREEMRVIYPDVPGRLLIGQQSGVTEQRIRAALAPYIESVLSYTPHLVEVAVKPFHESEAARRIETELSSIVRYAETNFVQRLVYSPGWFARKLL